LPGVEIETPHPHIVQIKFRVINAPHQGKPDHGLECLWVISETAPAKIVELLHSKLATHYSLELVFDGDQRALFCSAVGEQFSKERSVEQYLQRSCSVKLSSSKFIVHISVNAMPLRFYEKI
jgi:hypothetical protein